MTFSSIRRSLFSRIMSCCLSIAFAATMVGAPKFSYAGVMSLPAPGTMVNLSSPYVPLMLTGLTMHPENPLLMDFIVSTGNSGLDAPQVKEQSRRLIKYFLACLTIPEDHQWVNLSPYEKQRVIPDDLGHTVLGEDMLAQDYLLKQLTASLIYPERDLGRDFWDKVYTKAREEFGTAQIPVNTFNKVWILPDTAKVYAHKHTVFVVKSHLKVMLDEDYMSLSKHAPVIIDNSANRSGPFSRTMASPEGAKQSLVQVNFLGNQIVRQIIVPAVEEEVNTGKNFANLRQIYNSMILAVWFKKNLRQALLNQVYTDKAKLNGVNADDPAIKEKIYRQYIAAYRKGVFNYIKEDADPGSDQIIPRKYFSGGLTPVQHVDMASLSEAQTALSNKTGYDYLISGLTLDSNAKNVTSMPSTNAAMAAVDAEFIRPVVTIAPEDFKNLVEARQKGEVGVDHNVERRTLIPPSTNTIDRIVVQWARLPEAERVRLIAKEAEMFRKGQVAPIVMAGGEATRYGGPKAFKEVTPELGEFLGIKADNLRWFNQHFGVEVPLFLLSSETRIESFKQQLAERNYYGLQSNLLKWYVQGSVDTFIPTDAEIDTMSISSEMKEKYKECSAKLRQENPDGIYRFQGNPRPVVPGHLDAVSAFIVSGRLAEALEMGIEYIPVFNIDNLQAILKNQGIYAHFAESGADFGFILAEKNLLFSFKDKSGQRTIPRIFVRFRDNVLSFDDIHTFPGRAAKDGYRFVIDQRNKTVRVYEQRTGRRIDVDIEVRPETGGTLTQYEDTGEAIMKEGFELPSGFPHAQAPFFNTNTIILRARSLLRILGLPENGEGVRQLKAMSFEQRSALVRERIVKQVKANFELKEHVVPGEFPEYGVVTSNRETGQKETRITVSQVTRIMLQLAHLPGVKVQYYFLPRSEVFAPVKSPDDARPSAENSREDLEKYTLKANPAMTTKKITSPDGQYTATLTTNQGGTQIIRAFRRDVQIYQTMDHVQDIRFAGTTLMIGILAEDKEGRLYVEEQGIALSNKGLNATVTRNQARFTTPSLNTEVHRNPAMSATRGGIDLNAAHLKMQSEGEGVNITFDPAMIAQFRRGDFSGVRFQILDVVPINLMPLLGLN